MKISEMNWLQVEAYLERDDRAVVPLGSTEQHAYLSLCVDNILAERVATEAAEPLGVPVFPPLNYGLTPYFLAYPGTLSLSVETYLGVIGDLLGSLKRSGFKRVLLVNGHGGNTPAQSKAIEWMVANPEVRVKLHNWWNAPETFAKLQDIDPDGSHASWMENFPWTRLEGVDMPEGSKPMVDLAKLRALNPAQVRDYLGEGNMGGVFEKADEVMAELWRTGVAETRAALEGPWGL